MTLSLALAMTPVRADEFGRFVGRLILSDEQLDECFASDEDGFFSIFRLVEEFHFIDPNQIDWSVPSGTCVNGASIPAAFWSVMGGPWSGKYRRASVIHDHYVRTRVRTWQDTHRAFYYGMRAGDVSATQAKLMYYAVRRFGKRWDLKTRSLPECGSDNTDCGVARVAKPDWILVPEVPNGDISELVVGMDFDAMSLEEIDRIADEQLSTDILDPSR
ncbi:DUF1353 domain-containing protein [Albidovulum aquaemixtae]|uniref:DUF1353 domain-containing protein n=1 Tax=Albidovulum aquaemixtae TaxID=1542388 RepID=UPI0015E80DDD|nr:DUF1353 domain-containing protein [Defluviimonas aquaemixtae]